MLERIRTVPVVVYLFLELIHPRFTYAALLDDALGKNGNFPQKESCLLGNRIESIDQRCTGCVIMNRIAICGAGFVY